MKPRKRGPKDAVKSDEKKKQKFDSGESSTAKAEKCNLCNQNFDQIKLYGGHLNKSCEEFIVLTDEKLSVFTGEEESFTENELPTHKITHFSVYDGNGHLCAFDGGLVEKNVLLHVSGYIKPIYDEDSSSHNGIPAHDVGPINEWYIIGFDGGEKAIVGIMSAYAQYILMEPSEDYAPFFKVLIKKVELVKIVIEYLLNHWQADPTYEDLLRHIEGCGKSEITEDFLLQHAQFVCDQIYSFEGDADDTLDLILTSCVRTLINLAGVTFNKRKKLRQNARLATKKTNFIRATTTPLVRSIFENFFPDQIEKDKKTPRKRRCGVCEACQTSDCGTCSNCRDMVKYGGTGKAKQACKLRRCPNMAVEEAELSENEDAVEDVKESVQKKKSVRRSVNEARWTEEPVLETKGKKFYHRSVVGNFEITAGDYVMLNPEKKNEPLTIGKIEYMYEGLSQEPTTHVLILYRGSDTILGETANPQELFSVNICEDCSLGCIIRKVEVVYKETPNDWFNLGGTDLSPPSEDNEETFYISKHYDLTTGAFTDYRETKQKKEIDVCDNCLLQEEKIKFETPLFDGTVVTWRRTTYSVGSAVFLKPSVFNFSGSISGTNTETPTKVDETIYTEYYRKTLESKGSNLDTVEPFCVGQIEEISGKRNNIKIKVRIFYRPENTKSGVFLAHKADLNVLYWTEEMATTAFEEVVGKCYLMYCDVIESPVNWCEEGPYRFYFKETYNPQTYQFSEVPDFAKKIGYMGKGKGKGKTQTKSSQDSPPVWDKIKQPLRCMDVFAGCGGLAKGLHQSGVADTKWAIEIDVAAAHAFKLNNQDCQVFTEDCNSILQKVMSGEAEGLPVKGDVEMLIGGPPCQGFSGMNRFNAGQYSLFKNSLVVSLLSYCDYYRPKVFVLENVRNFVSFKRSMVLKLTLRCFLDIGYQVKFGVLQAGHYGVPQTRRRLVLVAVAPGYTLPNLPEPQNVFNKRGCQLSFALNGVRYTNGHIWTESAPYRTICVRDAISDLPEIKNGSNKEKIPYDEDAISHFQRKMRSSNSTELLVDHICKEMAPIVEARIAQIPEVPGSDWRDLPNISVKLSDGTVTNILNYTYPKKKQKKGEPNRGVCQCASGLNCDPSDRQMNTIIPWCLPHTADRHNHWAGLYGRLEWDGYFGTTITNPEPMGKQGRVLHPEQNRVVSVRECARSQGFPDHFKFYGNIMDKHTQVGNAVPPPLGKAIGLEIMKALVRGNPENR